MRVLPVFAISAFMVGCGTNSPSDAVVSVDDSDAAMNGAIENARRTFPQFLDHWDSMPNEAVGVKFAMEADDGGVEHIWFTPTRITSSEVTGTCANDPAGISGLKFGDSRTFGRSEISDWMLLVGDKCYGGYTVRILSEMEPENAPDFTFVDFAN